MVTTEEKKRIKEKETALIQLTNSFSQNYLDDNYAQLAEKAILKLGRKREVPFVRGQLEIWAAAVIYAIGQANFLFDKSFKPYASADDICDAFGAKKSTVSSKAAEIRKLLKIDRFSNTEFMTEHSIDTNPFLNMVMVNGLMLPINSLPEEVREQVKTMKRENPNLAINLFRQ